MLRLIFLLTLAASSLLADDPAAKPHYNLQSMTPAQIDREVAGKTRYDFEIAPEDGLIDATGNTIRAADLPAYFRERKLDAAAFVFLWIAEQSAPLDTLAPTVKPLGEYGFTKIVVRARPGVTPRQSATAGKKALVIQGKPNARSLTSADAAPDLSGRPAELRPDPLPRGVRYTFESDAVVRAAAAMITTRLLATPPSDASVFAESVLIYPGAWKVLRESGQFSPRAAKPMMNRIPLRGKTLTLDGGILQEREDLLGATEALRRVITGAGGGTLRALRATEMTKWWAFIALDIAEPVFVLETANGQHRFILTVVKDRVFSLDELNALPAL